MNQQTAHSEPITVSQLTEQIKSVLEDAFDRVCLVGELSNLNLHRSGHVYLSLKDSQSRIDGVVWRSTAQRLRYHPNPGDQIVVRGRLNIYAPQGSYKLIIDSIEPLGLGELQAQFEALKKKLGEEGLFDPDRRRRLPSLPRTVGVVTSATGAARRDIESVIHRRSPQIPIILYPASVQGNRAASEIVRGIKRLQADPRVDVIIVGRGGGSIEDLWAFNEEVVCRAISECTVPIISAVGHETDTTIADFVAEHRAPTPSAAAEVAVPVRDDLLYTIDMLSERLHRSLEHRMDVERHRISRLSLRLSTVISPNMLRRPLDASMRRLQTAIYKHVGTQRARLRRTESALRDQNPSVRLNKARIRLQMQRSQLIRLGETRVLTARSRLDQVLAKLNALSPLASLDRGFSITRKASDLVRNVEQLEIEDSVTILFAEGSAEASITALHDSHQSTHKPNR